MEMQYKNKKQLAVNSKQRIMMTEEDWRWGDYNTKKGETKQSLISHSQNENL
jgi:hypothetical protein